MCGTFSWKTRRSAPCCASGPHCATRFEVDGVIACTHTTAGGQAIEKAVLVQLIMTNGKKKKKEPKLNPISTNGIC